MAIFSKEEEVRNFFALFLKKLASHSEAGTALRNSGLVLHFRLNEPQARITIDTQSTLSPNSLEPVYFFDEAGPKPDLTLEMTTEALDELWSGKRDIFAAILLGKVKITGNIAKASKLLPLLKLIPPIYAETLAEFRVIKPL